MAKEVGNLEIVEPRLFDGVVADEIVASLSEVLDERPACSLVLAGGSTPSGVYRSLAKPPRNQELDWRKVKFFWGDERWVPQNHHLSNFKLVQETLLSHLAGVRAHVHAVNTSLTSASEGAEDYEIKIRKELSVNESQLPAFDLVLLGVGEDGHTASLFPHAELVRADSERVAVAVKQPVSGDDRVTLTPQVLLNARKIIFIVKGENKAAVMKRVLEGEESQMDLPAKLFLKVPQKITWFLDSSAALQLSNRGS